MGRDISKFFFLVVVRLAWSLVALGGWALARGLATLWPGYPEVIGDCRLTASTKHLSNKKYFWFYAAGQSVWL